MNDQQPEDLQELVERAKLHQQSFRAMNLDEQAEVIGDLLATLHRVREEMDADKATLSDLGLMLEKEKAKCTALKDCVETARKNELQAAEENALAGRLLNEMRAERDAARAEVETLRQERCSTNRCRPILPRSAGGK